MSRQSQIETLRTGIGAFNGRDFDLALSLLREDVEWQRFLSRAETGSDVVRGRDELREVWESQVEALDIRAEPWAFVEAGNRVAVPVRMVVRGSGSGIELSTPLTWLWTFGDDGLVAKVEAFEARAEALQTIGLSDAESVLSQIEATNEGDFERAMGLYAEDAELYVHPDAFLTNGTFSGKEAVGKWFGDWFATFEPGYSFVIDEAREVEGAILLMMTHSGRGRASGVEVEGTTAYLYRVRDGKVAAVALFPAREMAVDAASA